MPTIEIHINEIDAHYKLLGDVTDLWGNRRARFYMNDYLTAKLIDESSIVIPYLKDSDDDKERVLILIQEMINKFGFVENLSEHSQDVLADFISEKERFEEFSTEARNIWNNKINTGDFKKFTTVLKSALPSRTLYDLQLLAAYHLTFSQNACNFSVPGAGKTSVVYAAYSYLKNLPKEDKKHVNKLLIIGPLSCFGPWEDEHLACFGEKGDVQRLSGGIARDERIRHFLSPHSAEIGLISYQGIASNIKDVISYLRRYENNVMVVLDEAHKIKNTEGGAWAQAILSIAKFCKSRVVLTGTPTPNGYEDIYNLYNFIWPDKGIINYHPFQLKEMSLNSYDKRIPDLIDNLSPFFIRITKADLKKYMDLPEATENPPILIKMGVIQKEIYEYIENNYVDYFQNSLGSENNIKNALIKARLIRLMQASTNPNLLRKPIEDYYREEGLGNEENQKEILSNELFIDDSELIEKILHYREIEIPEKFKSIAKLTKDIIDTGGKVVIWGIFIQNIYELHEYLAEQGISSKLLIGETPLETTFLEAHGIDSRESIVREFNQLDSSFKVIIANPFAVAESISLHKTCHNAIYLERNFNAATFLQSKDRIHRVGLKPGDRINYYYILSANSIDETIHQRLKQKEERMLRIIESKDIPLINMNMDSESNDENDDLKALILDYVRRAAQDR